MQGFTRVRAESAAVRSALANIEGILPEAETPRETSDLLIAV
jgi:hypothetical protein